MPIQLLLYPQIAHVQANLCRCLADEQVLHPDLPLLFKDIEEVMSNEAHSIISYNVTRHTD